MTGGNSLLGHQDASGKTPETQRQRGDGAVELEPAEALPLLGLVGR